MNAEHLQLCASERWAEHLAAELVPWALGDGRTVDRLLEVGPGPGAATAVLRHRTARLTAVEYDAQLAARLAARFDGDARVEVVRGDAATLPSRPARSTAWWRSRCCTTCPASRRRTARSRSSRGCCGPAARCAARTASDSPGLRRLHEGDVLVPLDPLTLAARLRAAGFIDVEVEVLAFGVRFCARPAGP